jgi:hypothetical protein
MIQQQALAGVGALIRRATAIRIDNTEPAVAAFFSRRPGVVEEDRRADIVFEILGHVIKVIDVVTVHPVALRHVQAATRNGAAAGKSEADKWKKYRDHFDLDNLNADFVPFAVETYGTFGKSAHELLEWCGRGAYPLAEVGDKVVDVDGRFGAFMTRAYALLSVAVAAGNTQRLEAWMQPKYSPDFPVMAVDPVAAAIMDDGLGNEERDEEDEEEGDEDEEVILNEGEVDGMIVDAEQRAEDLIDLIQAGVFSSRCH